ncbi:inner membrane protein of type IV secretion of T-DNA complex VirB6 [Vibrio variabilis]|uniref:Inner membrane protein of type IV secretion of T-DNA complex VirB6 n=1 Tax=Vibrio variabilis TaxID=990271 RepID=A0ABQ0JG59_9VIBR|nr:inner membrane protein of type IV secretion of T-DNA complex VirB6 [Vibrio variabilis]
MFDTLFNFVETLTLQNIGQLVPIFMTTISPLIGACVVLYAIYLVYQSLYDAENMVIMESVKFMGSLALCATIAFSTTWYLDKIVPMVYYSGDDIANALLGAQTLGSLLDELTDLMMTRIAFIYDQINLDIWEGDTFTAMFLSLLMILILLIGFVPFIIISTVYLTVAKLMVGFLLILGPLFIMFGFFPSTRSMFQAWTGQCFNYILLIVVYSLGFSVLMALIELATPDSLSLKNCILTLILMAVCSSISTQIPTFCSALSGGVGINGLAGNLGAGASMWGGMLGAGAGALAKYSGANWAGGKAGGVAKKLGSNLLDKIKPPSIKPG